MNAGMELQREKIQPKENLAAPLEEEIPAGAITAEKAGQITRLTVVAFIFTLVICIWTGFLDITSLTLLALVALVPAQRR
jgi:hypothetical protein